MTFSESRLNFVKWALIFEEFVSPQQKLQIMQGNPLDLMTKEVATYDGTLYSWCDQIIVAKIKEAFVKDSLWKIFSLKILTKQGGGASVAKDKEAWLCKFYEYFMKLNPRTTDLNHILLNQELMVSKRDCLIMVDLTRNNQLTDPDVFSEKFKQLVQEVRYAHYQNQLHDY
jgi:hypothetical protein